MSATAQKASITTLLIYGFIREIKLNSKDIIPVSICDLCMSFYTGYQLIFYLNETIESELSLINFNEKPFKYECSLHNLSNVANTNWYNFNSGICKYQHFKAPKSVHSKISESQSKSSINNYYSMFTLCGTHYDSHKYNAILNCNAILINKNELNNSNINAYNWKLPSYPKQMTRENCAVYSYNNNTLYSLGGADSKHCLKLSFDEYDSKNPKWKQMSSLNETRASASVVNIKVKNKQKLCIVGGFGGVDCMFLKTMEILDITNNDSIDENENEEKKWMKLKYKIKFPVYKAGIFYDENNEYIYIGGGNRDRIEMIKDDRSPMAYFNITKKKWYYLPNTTLNHHDKPVIFKVDMNRLYIASSVCNGMEWIDLREGKKKANKWTVQTDDLSSSFKTEFLKWDEIRCNMFCELC